MSYIGNQPSQVAFLTDSFSGTGSTTVFTMSVAPANTASVLIVVSGVVKDPTTYSVSGTTLTFSAAPPSGTSNISARYLGIPASGVTTTAYRTITEFTATAGQTTFTPPSYTVGFINVYRNGVLLGSAGYTASNGTTVVLTTGATAGDLVTIESFYVSSVLNAIPNTAGAVNSNAIANGAVTQAKLGANVAGNGPAFSAYQSTAQAVATTTFTKVQLQTKEFDTANAFDATTNYRFTPQVAGYYQVNASIQFSAGNTASLYQYVAAIFKNGVEVKQSPSYAPANNGGATISALIFLNGSTDYIEFYTYQTVTSTTLNTITGVATYFQASMVRGA